MNILKAIGKFRKKKRHPHENLGMGIIRQYALIVPSNELDSWLIKGWIQARNFRDVHYAPKTGGTVILGRPKTLLEVDKELLLGCQITHYRRGGGSYGMGGAGFIGFTLAVPSNTDSFLSIENTLVYAVWGAAQYTLMDNRVIECNPQFYDTFHPWLSQYADENIPDWDDLSPILLGSTISNIGLFSNSCIITISKEGFSHTIEFLKNDPRLPPNGNGTARGDAFGSDTMGSFLVFQHQQAMLYV